MVGNRGAREITSRNNSQESLQEGLNRMSISLSSRALDLSRHDAPPPPYSPPEQPQALLQRELSGLAARAITGRTSEDITEFMQEGEPAHGDSRQRESTDIKEGLQSWLSNRNFYDFNSVKGNQDLQNLGEGLNDQEVKNNYIQVIKDIDSHWHNIQSLSLMEDGLTPTGDMLNHYFQCQIESIRIEGKVKPKKDRAYRGALSENTRSLRNLSNILEEASNSLPSNTRLRGLREQMEDVESGTLGKRRGAALKTIKRFWEKGWRSSDGKFTTIPDQWKGSLSRPMEDTERLSKDINDIWEHSITLRGAKNLSWRDTDQETKQMLRSDVFKAVLFFEAIASRLERDFSSNQPQGESSSNAIIP